jgi:hypothetical protein
MDFYRLSKDLGFNRYPIKVTISSTGITSPEARITIINQTPEIDVQVHQVRMHFGHKTFNRAFILTPNQKVTVTKKDKAFWHLTYDANISIIERRIQKDPPSSISPDAQPGIQSPAQLFNAIGMGDPKASWIEVDFNEYEGREFLRGKVQPIIDNIGKTIKANREN